VPSLIFAPDLFAPVDAIIMGFAHSRYPLLAFVPAVLFFTLIASSLYLAIVLVRAAISLMRVTREQRRILREARGGSSWLMAFLIRILGFPVSLEYARKPPARFAMLLALCCVSAFAMTLANFAVAFLPSAGIDGFILFWQLCYIERRSYDLFGLSTLVVPALAAGMLALIFLTIGGMTQKLVRRLLRVSLYNLQQIDHRRPVVFLRAFRDDQVPLRPPRLGLMGRAMDVGRRRTSLDEVLLEEATLYGPVVALGNPKDKRPPYGAARAYIDTASWQDAISDIVRKAIYVVICIDDTEGIWWEVDHLLASGQQDKTLFLIHPRYFDVQENAALMDQVLARLLQHAQGESLRQGVSAQRHLGLTDPILGFFVSRDGCLHILESASLSRFAYVLAIRMFLRHTT
jgi:hypothetical protein